MSYLNSIFQKEAPAKIVEKYSQILDLSVDDIVQQGELLLVKQKSQSKPKKCSFLLTSQALLYTSKVSVTNQRAIVSIKAKIEISWLHTTFYTKKSSDGSQVEYFISIQKGNKSVLLRCEAYEEYTQWVSSLSRLTLQSNFFKKYKLSALIGEGGSAKVYQLDSNVDSTKYACKKFQKETLGSETEYKALVSEITILRSLKSHPNILELEEIQETEKAVYIVTELLEGDRVTKRKICYNFKDIVFIARSVLSALKRLEELKIVHRDLKPANILLKFKNIPLKDNKIKIIDFGISHMCNGEPPILSDCGTLGYLAPESLNSITKSKLSPKMDVFSLGVLLYNGLTGKSLFVRNDETASIQASREARVNFDNDLIKSLPFECNLTSQETSKKNAG